MSFISASFFNDTRNSLSDFERACLDGKIQTVLYLINNKSTLVNFNKGMAQACIGGHINIVKLMLSNEANNFNECIYYASQRDYTFITKLLTEKRNQHENKSNL